MKKYLLILLLFFISVTEISRAQNFFPLSLGNKYQIKHSHADDYMGIYYTNYTTKYSIDDSLMYNGETFYRYNGKYFLYDSVQQKLFIYLTNYGKQLAADFNLQEGDEFITYMQGSPDTAVCNGFQYVNVFGQNRLQWEMGYHFGFNPPFISYYEYDFIDGIGNYRYYSETPAYNPSYTVYDTYTYYSAIITSQVYNYLNISLTLLTNLEDIQISDFPFSMNVSVNMPIIELLDSLYLQYMVVRDSMIIWDDQEDFNRTYYNVTVNPAPSNLRVGDEVKLKIVARDKSIFETRTSLPDSGYFSIKVLPDQISLQLYPLSVGNKWIYDGVFWDQTENYTYEYIRKVDSLVTKPNQLLYFEVEEYEEGSPAHNIFYERIDSLEGKVYRYDEDSIQSNNEYLIDDLNAFPGDTIMSYRFPTEFPYVLQNESDTSIFQTPAHFKIYDSNYLIEYQYTLAQHFGLISVHNYFDFGSDVKILKGAIINGNVYGDTTITGTDEAGEIVNNFSLSQNFPNPFNPLTNMEYKISNREFVMLKVYDILGNEVATLVNEEKPAGSYTIKFDGSKLASGVYFYQLFAGNFTATKKLILIK